MRRPGYSAVLLCSLLRAAGLPNLALDQPVRLELGPGETKSVEVALNRGEFVQIVSTPDPEIVVKTALFDPSGERIAIAPSLGGTGGKAVLAAYSGKTGVYRIDIQSQMFRKEQRDCTVRLMVQRAAGEDDRVDAQAHREFARASVLAEKGGADRLETAVKALDEPIRLSRVANDRLLEMRALFGKGQFLAMAGKLRESLPWFDQALPLARTMNERRAEAHLLSVVALVHTNLEENREALDLYQQALEIQRAAGQSWETALTLDNLAESESALGRFDLALEYLREEEAIREDLNDELGLNQTRVGLGDLYLSLGDSERAIESLVQTLPNWGRLNDHEFESAAHNSLGLAYMRLGELDFAETALKDALRIREQLGNARLTGETLIARSQLESIRGNRAGALATYEQALALVRKAEYKHGETLALLGIADVYRSTGRPALAADRLKTALQIALATGERYDEALVRRALGLSDEALGDPAGARRELDSALAIQSEIGDRFGEVMSLGALADLDRKQGLPEPALARLNRARELVEFAQSSLLDADLRAGYLASQREIYELSASLLMELDRKSPGAGYGAQAFEISEQAHARTLLDALGSARIGMEGVDAKLLAHAQALDAAIHARAAAAPGSSPVSRSALNKLLAERNQLEVLIRASAANRNAPDETAPRSLAEVRAGLSPDTALLEYLVSPRESHLWVVTTKEFRHFALPPEDVLKRAATRLTTALTERNRTASGESPAGRAARIATADIDTNAAGARLARMVFPQALGRLSQSTILIVGDGALHGAPFAALAWPDGKARTLVSAPSASALAAIRARPAHAAGRRVLIVADPVYSAEDARVSGLRTVAGQRDGSAMASAPPARSALDFGGKIDLVRLRMSRQEAGAIAKLAAPRETRQLLDFDASLAAFRSADPGAFDIIHVAAHTLLDSRHPNLSGVVLSLVDRRGQAEDGFLRLSDIYRLRIGAELVTLSACESTLGKEVRGEGLLSLARGFLYAGANRVLASLWSVDDRATSAFMESFYRGLLRQHLPAAAALRLAQAQMQKDPRWRSPYYWAAFTIQGDWR